MITLLLASLLCVQADDPVKDAEVELQAFLKTVSPIGISGAKEYLEQAGQHAARQFGGKEMKRGIAIMEMAFDGLAKAIKDSEARAPELRKALLQLEKGRKRAAEAESDERRSVAYRYAIDRITLLWQTEQGTSAGLFNEAVKYISDANYAEAVELLGEAEAMLPALKGSTVEATPQGPRWAAILMAHALQGQGKYRESATALRRGLTASPDFVEQQIVLGKLHTKPADFEKALGALEAHVRLNGDDKDALLVLAFERYFTEKRVDAKEVLQKLLRLAPKDEAAKLLMDHVEDEK